MPPSSVRLVRVARSAAGMCPPPVLKFACNAFWRSGGMCGDARCAQQLRAATSAHLFGCDGLVGLARQCFQPRRSRRRRRPQLSGTPMGLAGVQHIDVGGGHLLPFLLADTAILHVEGLERLGLPLRGRQRVLLPSVGRPTTIAMSAGRLFFGASSVRGPGDGQRFMAEGPRARRCMDCHCGRGDAPGRCAEAPRTASLSRECAQCRCAQPALHKLWASIDERCVALVVLKTSGVRGASRKPWPGCVAQRPACRGRGSLGAGRQRARRACALFPFCPPAFSGKGAGCGRGAGACGARARPPPASRPAAPCRRELRPPSGG